MLFTLVEAASGDPCRGFDAVPPHKRPEFGRLRHPTRIRKAADVPHRAIEKMRHVGNVQQERVGEDRFVDGCVGLLSCSIHAMFAFVSHVASPAERADIPPPHPLHTSVFRETSARCEKYLPRHGGPLASRDGVDFFCGMQLVLLQCVGSVKPENLCERG